MAMLENLFFGFLTILTSYEWYIVWFQPSKFQEKIIKSYENLPKWMPFRDLNIRLYRTDAAMWFWRVMTSIALLFLLIAELEMLIAFLMK